MTGFLGLQTLGERSSFSTSLYNSMPSVETANAAIRIDDRLSHAIGTFGPLFERHGVAAYCGINLLHRHWDVDDDEFPEQIKQRHNHENQLNTRPVTAARFGQSAAASWVVNADGDSSLKPFEFSSDPFARDFACRLLEKTAFFAEARQALIDNELHRHFGICVAVRQSLSDLADGELIEITESGRQSIVVEKIMTPAERETSIQTVWVFGSADATECQPSGTRCIGSCRTSAAHCMEIITLNPKSREHNHIEASHNSSHRGESSHNGN